MNCNLSRIPIAMRSPAAPFACLVAMLFTISCGCNSRTPTATPPPDQTETSVEKTTTPSGEEVTQEAVAAPFDRDATMAKADQFATAGDFPSAAATLRKALLVQPDDAEVLFMLANVEAAGGNLQTAIDVLDEIPEDHPEARLPALGQSADWLLQLERYEEAEQRYLQVLEKAPQFAQARRQLAHLLNRQGRRHEAAVHIQELCKQGNVRQDELHSLIVLSDPMYDDPTQAAGGETPYWPIGSSAEARKLFSETKYVQAVAALHDLVATGKSPASIVALYGRAAAEAQDDASFHWWLSRTNERTREFSEYWAAIGAYLLSHHRFEEAARALAEAVDRDPTDLLSIGRLRQAFLVLEDDAAAEKFVDRWNATRDSLKINNRIAATQPPNPDAIAELAVMLVKLDRPLEAVLWKAIEAHYRGTPQSERLELNTQRQQLVAAGQGFPTLSERLCGIDLQRYPMPTFEGSQAVDVNRSPIMADNEKAAAASIENVASQVGLQHNFLVASQPLQYGFSIYQILGGAVAVLDFDLDGASDLYFAQGGADPPTFRGEYSNQLFRNLISSVVDVTAPAGTSEYQYTVGLTAGDWNQDGFPDLVSASIGANVLMINNGDGTFSQRQLDEDNNTQRVPSSVAMADLTGDGLPDIFQAFYVDDPDMTVKPATNSLGQPLQAILPTKFQPGGGRLIENDSAGRFSIKHLTSQPSDASTSLGLIVTDFDGVAGNEIFVGNDLNPNQLWRRDSSQQWTDVAQPLGCAFSYTGSATASMGIAASDFDRNGSLDLHITNYQEDTVSLFLGEGGAYQDRNIQYQLADASRVVLGFGTQAIDYDNDSRDDLVVTNGHIEQAVEIPAPFQQAPQLFCNLGSRFQLTEVTDSSDYWNSKHLGRALARLDFNRDGKNDFVITHIGEPSALLLNQSPTDHHWLQLQLVGTKSERDGIGARVRIRFGEQESTDWVIAGDGYLSRNEPVVSFGLNRATRVEEIDIHWPSGNHQTFQDIPADQRLLITENDEQPYTLPNPRF